MTVSEKKGGQGRVVGHTQDSHPGDRWVTPKEPKPKDEKPEV